MDVSTPIGLRRVYNISTLADTLHRVTSVTPLSGADIAGIQQGTLSRNHYLRFCARLSRQGIQFNLAYTVCTNMMMLFVCEELLLVL